jgi:phospholipase/carboxylesterase
MAHCKGLCMTKTLDGPRREPRGRRPGALIVFLHGYGANGDDLIALADDMRSRLPDAVFVAPHAPEKIPGMHGGLQWFALTLSDVSEYWRGVVHARHGVDRFLDAELARYGLKPDRLVLVGFSQGTMLALHVGPRRAVAPAAIVGFSGLLAGPEHLGETTVRPPLLLVHGGADDLIPADALHWARESLAAAGFLVEWHLREGLGHGIDDAGQHFARHFIAAALRGRQHL